MKPNEIEQLLQSLTPEPLAGSRDELLFQAGYAAGNRRQSVPWFWRLAAAVLLVACLGMSLALQRQAIELHDAQIALANMKAQQPADASQLEQSPRAELANTDHSGSPLPAAANFEPSGSPPPAAGRGAGGEGPDQSHTAQPQTALAHPPSSLDESDLRMWQQIARAEFPNHGRLTARGWIDGAEPPRSETEQPEPSPSPSRKREPQNYLELRQLHLEG